LAPLVSELQVVRLYWIWIVTPFHLVAVELAFMRGDKFMKKINQIYDLQIKTCLFHTFLEFTGNLDEPEICIYVRENWSNHVIEFVWRPFIKIIVFLLIA